MYWRAFSLASSASGQQKQKSAVISGRGLPAVQLGETLAVAG